MKHTKGHYVVMPQVYPDCKMCRVQNAAPDLLIALYAVREFVESIAILQGMNANGARQGRSYKQQAIVEINEAIAKAEGRKP